MELQAKKTKILLDKRITPENSLHGPVSTSFESLPKNDKKRVVPTLVQADDSTLPIPQQIPNSSSSSSEKVSILVARPKNLNNETQNATPNGMSDKIFTLTTRPKPKHNVNSLMKTPIKMANNNGKEEKNVPARLVANEVIPVNDVEQQHGYKNQQGNSCVVEYITAEYPHDQGHGGKDRHYYFVSGDPPHFFQFF